jgi:hypothetical protein
MFYRSLGWKNSGNELAQQYIDLLNRRLAEEQEEAVQSKK